MRPEHCAQPRLTKWWGGVESNRVGTHEFMNLVELLGSEAYMSGNMGSMPPRAMADWMEYMTADGTSTLAEERRLALRSISTSTRRSSPSPSPEATRRVLRRRKVAYWLCRSRPARVATNLKFAGQGQVLTAAAMDAHNTFERPQNLVPAPYSARPGASGLVLELPPKSVVVVTAAPGPFNP